MQNLSGTYVHRGDAERRRQRIKRLLSLVGILAAGAYAYSQRQASPEVAQAAVAGANLTRAPLAITPDAHLRQELNTAQGQVDILKARLDRAEQVINFSARYGIGADVASMVYDASLGEGIDPELAFRLVKLESDFNTRAVSSAGAVGLTQLMPATARFFQKDVRRDQLFDPMLNLRIGFRYLRTLVDEYGDVNLALLVYNRGEVAVRTATAQGINPTNGYDRILMRGYKGKGVVN
jgi:soluble lytic murein transglycosylase-like protein